MAYQAAQSVAGRLQGQWSLWRDRGVLCGRLHGGSFALGGPLDILPGAIICGLLTYLVAWFIVLGAPIVAASARVEPTPVQAGGAE